jgi:hypothetical protein
MDFYKLVLVALEVVEVFFSLIFELFQSKAFSIVINFLFFTFFIDFNFLLLQFWDYILFHSPPLEFYLLIFSLIYLYCSDF